MIAHFGALTSAAEDDDDGHDRGDDEHSPSASSSISSSISSASFCASLSRVRFIPSHAPYSPPVACMRSPRRLHSPQVRFIPSHAPSASVAAHAGEPTLACFAELALHQDRHLVWSVAPLLKRELTPPRSHWEALGVHHPPPTSLVLAHGLTISAEAPDAWPYPEDPAELVMGAIWATLNERWHTIPPDLRARLSTAPLLL